MNKAPKRQSSSGKPRGRGLHFASPVCDGRRLVSSRLVPSRRLVQVPAETLLTRGPRLCTMCRRATPHDQRFPVPSAAEAPSGAGNWRTRPVPSRRSRRGGSRSSLRSPAIPQVGRDAIGTGTHKGRRCRVGPTRPPCFEIFDATHAPAQRP
jgi:hypothetical protein